MKRLALAAALLAALHLMGAAAHASILPPTDLDPLDLGIRVMPDRASDFMTPDLTSQGGSAPRSLGTLVATVWLKNGLYTYRLVVTPAEGGVGQFSTQFNVDGFDPNVHKVGWSYSEAIQAGAAGSPSNAFLIIWSLHNSNAMLLNWTVNPSQTGFWSNRTPLTFFFQSPYGPQLSSYNFTASQGGTALNYGPSAMSLTLSYDGKIRDRVGPGSVTLGADGILDGTLTAMLNTTGGRTIRRLQLQSNAPGTWDTDSATPAWILGVADSLDGPLLNSPTTMGVNFGVADGGSFKVFAADYADIEFVPGVTLTLTATFSDGTILTATTVAGTPPSPPSLTLSYDGKLRDRVGPGSVGLGADGAMDGTLTATLRAAGGRTVTRLQLQSSAPGTWDTEAATSAWVLGAASTLDGALLNDPATMAVNFAVADGGSFKVFAADYANIEFVPGVTLTLTLTFSDGTVLTAMTIAGTITPTSPPSLTLGYDGKVRDRVGPGSVGLGADGAMDGTLTATLSAAGGRTVTRLQLQSNAPGTWDTEAATSAWVLGAASTLDGALLNNPATMAVNFAVPDGGSFKVFAADYANIEFVPGVTLTLTATFSDGTVLTAMTVAGTVTAPSPPSLTLSYDGKLRDRVGPGSVGLGGDGALDGTLTAALSAAGGRTVTRMQLQSNAPGTWDTDSATPAWVLGVAITLDAPLLNDPGTMAVNFAVADGGSFKVFAADWADIEFAPGTTLTLTVGFSDGTSVTATTVAATTIIATMTPASPPSLTLSYDGKLRDRVSQGDLGLGPDGVLDGTLTATLTASGGRTITRLQLQSSAPGTWDTEGGTSAWVLGVASTLDGALLNDPGTMAVNFAVADGGGFHVFAADWADIEFTPGTTLTLTAVFSDGTSARASVTVPSL